MANPEVLKQNVRDVLRGDAIGDTLYSEQWVLGVLIKLTKYASGEEEKSLALENDLCRLWDMCTENDVIHFAGNHGCIELAVAALRRCDCSRLSEILVGIIGNMCSSSEVREKFKEDSCMLLTITGLLRFPHSDTLIQTMRVLQIFAWEVLNTSPLPCQKLESENNMTNNQEELNDPKHSEVEKGGNNIDNDVNKADDCNNEPVSKHESDSKKIDDDFDDKAIVVTDNSESRETPVRHSLPESKDEVMNQSSCEMIPALCDKIENSSRGKVGDLDLCMEGGNTNLEVSDCDENSKQRRETDPIPEPTTQESFVSSTIQEKEHKVEDEASGAPNTRNSNNDDGTAGSLPAAIPGPIDINVGAIGLPEGVPGPSRLLFAPHPQNGNRKKNMKGNPTNDISSRCVKTNENGENDDHDNGNMDDNNSVVVAISRGDGNVTSRTSVLWFDYFTEVSNWLPEVNYILNYSKNAVLIEGTWSLLKLLSFIRVNGLLLSEKIASPDTIKSLLESFKEFCSHHADLYSLELYNVANCRKGLITWTAILYSFTLEEDSLKICYICKGEILKHVFQMLRFYMEFCPVDEELDEYLMHTFTILCQLLRVFPYEFSALYRGLNIVIELLDEVKAVKRSQRGLENPYETEALNYIRQYLGTVYEWLNEFDDDEVGEKFRSIQEAIRQRIM